MYVRRVDDEGQLTSAVEALAAFPVNARGQRSDPAVLLEELLKGPEVSVETVSHGGAVHVVGVTDKSIGGSPAFIETGHMFPAALPGADTGLEDVRRLAGRVQGVNVKLAKCGGSLAALRIAETFAGSGTELMLGCLTASSLGLAPAVHLAGRARWTDLDGHLLLAHDPWTGIGGEDGIVRTTGLPGLGVQEVAALGRAA